mmetsp:Transcript_200/g.593  ORF Transcript_200/g.593 Transcript_200/m.593 type:complete len:207 (-) Transcript_200:947-1567(-)
MDCGATSCWHIGHWRSASMSAVKPEKSAGKAQLGHVVMSLSMMCRPVATQYGIVLRVDGHSSTVSATRASGSKGEGVAGSSRSSRSPGLRTIASILRLYASPICERYSGRISVVACSKAAARSPERWHSMTVEVIMGTTCMGKREMCLHTRMSMRAPLRWSPSFVSGRTSTYEWRSMRLSASSCGTRMRCAVSSRWVSKRMPWAMR